MTLAEYIHITTMESKRTLSEILIDADSSNTFLELTTLSNELMENKDKFEIYEIEYGLEHIADIGAELQRQNIINQLFK